MADDPEAGEPENYVEAVEHFYGTGEGIEGLMGYAKETDGTLEDIVLIYMEKVVSSSPKSIVGDALDPKKAIEAAKDVEEVAESFNMELSEDFYQVKEELKEKL
ncbi:MAG: hypothetical protein ACLFTA_01825 [Candidatus Nanohaloarchaea archaeon]